MFATHSSMSEVPRKDRNAVRLVGLRPISPKMLVFLVIAVTAGCGLAIAVSITGSAWIRAVWL